MLVDVYEPIRDEIMRLLDNGRRSVFAIRNISKKPRQHLMKERVKIMGIIFWTVVIKRKWPTSKKSMMTPFKIVQAQVHQTGGMQV